MASKRFSRILQSAKYFSAIDNYIKYITDSTKRGQRVGQGQPRAKSIKLYLTPFGVILNDQQNVAVSAAETTWNLIDNKTEVNTRVSATPDDEDLVIKLAKFTPARIIVTSGRSNTGVAKTSAVTGMKYLSYGGRSTSFPFGSKTGSTAQGSASTAIITQLQTDNVFSNAVYSLKEEKVG
jgi:hypothetical protein